MIINENGIKREMTVEEEKIFNNATEKYCQAEKVRQYSKEEIIALDIKKRINDMNFSANEALHMIDYHPTFEKLVEKSKKGESFPAGYRFSYKGELYATVQQTTTFEAHFPPDVGTESLYEKVCETHSGSLEDPIPYSGNMRLEEEFYYEQYGIIYYCYNSSINPVVQPLKELSSFVRIS